MDFFEQQFLNVNFFPFRVVAAAAVVTAVAVMVITVVVTVVMEDIQPQHQAQLKLLK